MLRWKAPLWLAIPIVFGIGASLYWFDNTKAEAATSGKPKVWSNEECLSCHTNERVLKLMQSKRGDPTYCQAAYDALTKASGKDFKPGYGSK